MEKLKGYEVIKRSKKKVGAYKGKPRICLWSTALIKAGFDFGQFIIYTYQRTEGEKHWSLCIGRPTTNQGRKVSKVMNHGKPIPVIDIKCTDRFTLEEYFEIGESIIVTICEGRIFIQKEA